MTRYKPTKVEVDDARLKDAHHLGIDGDGEQHYVMNQVDPTIYVTNYEGDGQLLRFDLTEHDVRDWIAHVRQQRGGWQTLDYDDVEATDGQQEVAC